MLNAKLLGLPDPMERVPQAHEPVNLGLVGHQAGEAAAQRLAANDQVRGPELFDYRLPTALLEGRVAC